MTIDLSSFPYVFCFFYYHNSYVLLGAHTSSELMYLLLLCSFYNRLFKIQQCLLPPKGLFCLKPITTIAAGTAISFCFFTSYILLYALSSLFLLDKECFFKTPFHSPFIIVWQEHTTIHFQFFK